jgi:hypothetical protein
MTNKTLDQLGGELEQTLQEIHKTTDMGNFYKELMRIQDENYHPLVYCDSLSDVADGWYEVGIQGEEIL